MAFITGIYIPDFGSKGDGLERVLRCRIKRHLVSKILEDKGEDGLKNNRFLALEVLCYKQTKAGQSLDFNYSTCCTSLDKLFNSFEY